MQVPIVEAFIVGLVDLGEVCLPEEIIGDDSRNRAKPIMDGGSVRYTTRR